MLWRLIVYSHQISVKNNVRLESIFNNKMVFCTKIMHDWRCSEGSSIWYTNCSIGWETDIIEGKIVRKSEPFLVKEKL